MNFWKKLILTYSDDTSKNEVWFKLHKYFHENKKKYTSITLLIDEIEDNIRVNPLKLLKTTLISAKKKRFHFWLSRRIKRKSWWKTHY